jgi:hypothetical protein
MRSEKYIVKFQRGRDGGLLTRIEGIIAFPQRNDPFLTSLRPGDEWEVEVVGQSRSGNALFLQLIRRGDEARRELAAQRLKEQEVAAQASRREAEEAARQRAAANKEKIEQRKKEQQEFFAACDQFRPQVVEAILAGPTRPCPTKPSPVSPPSTKPTPPREWKYSWDPEPRMVGRNELPRELRGVERMVTNRETGQMYAQKGEEHTWAESAGESSDGYRSGTASFTWLEIKWGELRPLDSTDENEVKEYQAELEKYEQNYAAWKASVAAYEDYKVRLAAWEQAVTEWRRESPRNELSYRKLEVKNDRVYDQDGDEVFIAGWSQLYS